MAEQNQNLSNNDSNCNSSDKNHKVKNLCCTIGTFLGLIIGHFVILPTDEYVGAIAVLLYGVLAFIGALVGCGVYSFGRWISKTKLFNRLYE